MEQKRPVIDQPSRCSLLILPFESRRSIEFSPASNGNEPRPAPIKEAPKKGEGEKKHEVTARARRIERKKNGNRETSWKEQEREESELDEQISIQYSLGQYFVKVLYSAKCEKFAF